MKSVKKSKKSTVYETIAKEELDEERPRVTFLTTTEKPLQNVLGRIKSQLETARENTLGIKQPTINPIAYGYTLFEDEQPAEMFDEEKQRVSIYLKSFLSRKVVLHINEIGQNIPSVIRDKLKSQLEGKCSKEGYIRPNSIQVIKHSGGKMVMGALMGGASMIEFQVLFECLICNPVTGMRFMGTVIHNTKAGLVVRASTGRNANIDIPITAYISRDHHYNNDRFVRVKEGSLVLVRVLKSHFEIGDKNIYVIGLIDDYGDIEREKQDRERIKTLQIQHVDARRMLNDPQTLEGRRELREIAKKEKGVTSKYAAVWLFMKNVEYMAGVLVSAWSWKMSGSKADTVVMVTPDIASKDYLMKDLKIVFDRIVVVDYISVKSRLRSEIMDKYVNFYTDGYTKWACLQLAEYEKVLLVDADTVIINCMDDLFENVEAPAGTFSSPWLRPYSNNKKKNPFYDYEIHGMEIPRDVMEQGKQTNFLIGTSVLLEPSQEAYDRFILWLESEAQREDGDGVVGFGYTESGSMLDEQAISLFYHDSGYQWKYIHQKYNEYYFQ